MSSNEKFRSPLPFSLNIKIYIARLALISEYLAPYIFKIFILSSIFIILALTEFLPLLPYWLHILLLTLFFFTYLFIIISFILKFKWPTNIICAKRIEQDNNVSTTELQRATWINYTS